MKLKNANKLSLHLEKALRLSPIDKVLELVSIRIATAATKSDAEARNVHFTHSVLQFNLVFPAMADFSHGQS